MTVYTAPYNLDGIKYFGADSDIPFNCPNCGAALGCGTGDIEYPTEKWSGLVDCDCGVLCRFTLDIQLVSIVKLDSVEVVE